MHYFPIVAGSSSSLPPSSPVRSQHFHIFLNLFAILNGLPCSHFLMDIFQFIFKPVNLYVCISLLRVKIDLSKPAPYSREHLPGDTHKSWRLGMPYTRPSWPPLTASFPLCVLCKWLTHQWTDAFWGEGFLMLNNCSTTGSLSLLTFFTLSLVSVELISGDCNSSSFWLTAWLALVLGDYSKTPWILDKIHSWHSYLYVSEVFNVVRMASSCDGSNSSVWKG